MVKKGLEQIGKSFEKNEGFIPYMMLGAKVFKGGIEIPKPHIMEEHPSSRLGTAVIGIVFGNLHDLGKNLVVLVWSISGF